MVKVGILGASGFTGIELLQHLQKHEVEVPVLNSTSFAGKKVSSLYPEFSDKELEFTNFSIEQINSMDLDLIFLALPHTVSMQFAPKLNCKIVDLSADYRFKDVKVFEKVYSAKHLDLNGNKKAVFGCPELFRKQIKKAELVANPGCYATSMILSGIPLVKKNLVKNFIFDCVSGYSGVGREKANDEKYLATIKDNYIGYNLSKHRHKYEVQQFLGKNVSFTPHVFQVFRGICCTGHILLKKTVSVEKLKKIYSNFFKNEPFVEVFNNGIPTLHDVQNSNFFKIGGFEIDECNQLVTIGCLDNLVKGASGQAIQNMNLMLGFDEKKGLT